MTEHEEHIEFHRKAEESFATAAPGEILKQGFAVSFTAEALRDQLSVIDLITGPRRRGHLEYSLKDPKWLSARDAWVERYARIAQEGVEFGYLEHSECYECSGELVPTTDTRDSTFVYDETEEEFAKRVAAARRPAGETAIFPMQHMRKRDES